MCKIYKYYWKNYNNDKIINKVMLEKDVNIKKRKKGKRKGSVDNMIM